MAAIFFFSLYSTKILIFPHFMYLGKEYSTPKTFFLRNQNGVKVQYGEYFAKQIKFFLKIKKWSLF
jgi:hypothetical protein